MSNIASMLSAAAAKHGKPAAAPQQRDALVWENVDPSALSAEAQAAFYAIGKARSAFEAIMTDMLEPPEHLKLAFAYKRGLAIALAPRVAPSNGLANLIARANKG